MMQKPITIDSTEKPIVFFDGVCGLCNKLVDFLIRKDRHQKLTFAPLQGVTALAKLNEKDRCDMDTLVFIDRKGVHYRSTAALRISRYLSGGWSLMYVFIIVPPIIRDRVYRLVAKRRYAMFGKKESCRLPTPEERGRLLP